MKLLLLFAASIQRAHAAATPPSELLASLSQAGLGNTHSISEALSTIELHSLQDIRMLDAGERAEMFVSLEGMGVGLGSRAKLRRLADVQIPSALENTNWAFTRPESTRRQLQQGSGGGSMDSIALAITALLGIASYLVQAKISRDAEKSQKDSDRAHADRARAEMKAEIQLARVMTQMEHFVAPFTSSQTQLMEAVLNTMKEVDLTTQIEHWQLAWLPVPIAPHIEVHHFSNPASMGARMRSPYFKLARQDIAVLESDPAARQRCGRRPLGHKVPALVSSEQSRASNPVRSDYLRRFVRYTELVGQTWLPPLRALVELFTTQVRHRYLASVHHLQLGLHVVHHWRSWGPRYGPRARLTDAPERRRRLRAAGGADAQSTGPHLGSRTWDAEPPCVSDVRLRPAARVCGCPLAAWRLRHASAGGANAVFRPGHDRG
jgi:hypothetical protein